ncbi:CopL family metal-binding regulatory protein [Denitratimonas sp. CY0512]
MLLALALVVGGPSGAGVGMVADVQMDDCHRAAEAATAAAGISLDQGLAGDGHAVAAEAGGDADFTDCCEPGCDPTACGACLHHCAADVARGLAGYQVVPQAGPVFFSTRHTSPVLSGVFRPPIG